MLPVHDSVNDIGASLDNVLCRFMNIHHIPQGLSSGVVCLSQFREWNMYSPMSWASYQIPKIEGCACAGNTGNVFCHRGLPIPTCITELYVRDARAVMHTGIPLTSCFLISWWWGKHSRHSRRMRKPQFYVSGKRPIIIVYPLGVHNW